MRALPAGDASVAMRAGDAIVDAGDADGPGMRTVREDCESAFGEYLAKERDAHDILPRV